MADTPRYYQLVIRNQADDGDLLVLSSFPGDENCLLSLEPNADGQRVNVYEGSTQIGVVIWRAIDRDDGSDFRTITAKIADVNARNQMLSNRCIGRHSPDGSAWTTFHTGYLNRKRLDNALEFEFTVGDTDRREEDAELFKTLTPTFGRGSCILGGPIVAIDPVAYGETPKYAFAGVNDFGPVRMQKVANIAGLGFCITLVMVGGYVRPYYRQPLTRVTVDEIETINRLAAQWFQWNPIPYVTGGQQPFGDFPGLVARLRRVSDGNVIDTRPVARPVGLAARITGGAPDGSHEFMVVGTNATVVGGPLNPTGLAATLKMIVRWPAPLSVPANGTQYDVLVYPSEVSENAPLHVAGNPVDLAVQAWTQEGIPYDTDAYDAVRAELARLWVEYRYKKSVKLTDFVEKQLFGPWGFGARYNAAGAKVMFTTRSETPPSAGTIGTDDLVMDE